MKMKTMLQGKNLPDVEVVISLIGKQLWVVIPVASQRFPATVSASKLQPCVPLPNP
jgi:hypothetical protein